MENIVRNKEMLDKCEMRGARKIAPLWHKCSQAKQGMYAKGVQFYCFSSTYPANVLTLFYFLTIEHLLNFDTSAEQSEAHVLDECIKNCSIFKLYNKLLIINSICTSG